MEAVNGKSIGQRMRKGERFSSREILKTGIALSGILCYLHAQNPPVFYRDLKPDNVMITERGEIYLWISVQPEQKKRVWKSVMEPAVMQRRSSMTGNVTPVPIFMH